MNKYNYRTYTIRLKMDDPQQAKIVNVLDDLNKVIHKSVNQFVVDAIEFYMQHFNEAQLTKANNEKHPEPEFVTEERLKQVLSDRDSKIPEIVCEQLIRMIGYNLVFANVVGTNPAAASVIEQTITGKSEETELKDSDFVEDEALLDDVMKWS